MRGFCFHRLVLLAAALSLACAVSAQTHTEGQQAPALPETLSIPDGTPVKLRFAQPIWGMEAGGRIHPIHAKPGDAVRLVVAADVSIDGQVVIPKGSPGQATVKSVWIPARDRNGVQMTCTCFSLHLDWVKSLDDQSIPLRPSEKGNDKPFSPDVHSTHAGTIAKAVSLRRGLPDALTGAFIVKLIHQKDWLPAGTRMIAYVRGNILLDASEIREAQMRMPVPNETGLVMIYRTKGQKDRQVVVTCDSKEIATLGSRQFAMIEMEPGKHTCHGDPNAAAEFTVTGGQEYYLYLEASALTGNWRLSLVDNLEGEDGVAAADPVVGAAQVSTSK